MALNHKFVKSCAGKIVLLSVIAATVGCSNIPFSGKSNQSGSPQLSEAQKEAAQSAKEDQDFEVLEPAAATPTPSVTKATELPMRTPASAASQAPAAKSVLDIPKEPNTVLITMGEKDKSHPFFGKGHPNGFLVNGVMGDDIVVRRGDLFTFRVDTDVKHDFYITTNPAGWGSSVYTDGVTGQFTYKGDVTLQTGDSTPETLYYQCRNHQNMGGRIVIVDKKADVAAIKKKLAAERQAALAKLATGGHHSDVNESKAKQKVAYAKMMVGIRGKQLDAATKVKVDSNLKAADAALAKGDFGAAFDAAEIAAGFLTTSGTARAEKANVAEAKKAYEEKLQSIDSIKESHKRAYDQAKKGGDAKPVNYDKARVDGLIKSAADLAKQEKYPEAKKDLTRAEYLVTSALNEMIGSRTVVFELKFDTPKDEYEYEKKRYFSYIELIPTAIEMRKPPKDRIEGAQQFVDKAKFFAEKSEESLAAGRVDEAIVIIKDATAQLRVALMRLGVSM